MKTKLSDVSLLTSGFLFVREANLVSRLNLPVSFITVLQSVLSFASPNPCGSNTYPCGSKSILLTKVGYFSRFVKVPTCGFFCYFRCTSIFLCMRSMRHFIIKRKPFLFTVDNVLSYFPNLSLFEWKSRYMKWCVMHIVAQYTAFP